MSSLRSLLNQGIETAGYVAGKTTSAVVYGATATKDITVQAVNKSSDVINSIPSDKREMIKDGAVFTGVAAGTIVAAPAVLGAVGFGSAGIAAGSAAAKLMSVAWSSGVGVGAIGAAQSIGAAGLSWTTAGASGAVATGVYKAAKSRFWDPPQ